MNQYTAKNNFLSFEQMTQEILPIHWLRDFAIQETILIQKPILSFHHYFFLYNSYLHSNVEQHF